ncbi:MAG: tetratricopeptide repeat protein [Planctomycetota bacterium]
MKQVFTILSMPVAWSTLIAIAGLIAWFRAGDDFWASSDLRGQRLMDAGDFADASDVFRDPRRRGMAQYRAGEFKEAAAIFGLMNDDDSQFNLGNSLVMQGQYDQAVEIYDRILERDPGRKDVMINRTVATGRGERVRDEGGQMTDGMLGADEIVYDAKASSNPGSKEVEEKSNTSGLSDQEMRGMWLRQVQTTPGDFLRAKFAYQNAVRDSKPAEESRE